jgi:hypothetical protein
MRRLGKGSMDLCVSTLTYTLLVTVVGSASYSKPASSRQYIVRR